MYHWIGKLAGSFLRAAIAETDESDLSKDMVIPIGDLTQAFRSFIKPRDLNRYAHSKNGLQIAILEVLIAVREATLNEDYKKREPLQGALIMLEACAVPDSEDMINIPRSSMEELRSHMHVIENAARILKKNKNTIGDSVPLMRGRVSHQLIDEMRGEIIDLEKTADALVKLADNFYAFFAQHDPARPQEPKHSDNDTKPPKPAGSTSPRPQFLGGIPRK